MIHALNDDVDFCPLVLDVEYILADRGSTASSERIRGSGGDMCAGTHCDDISR